VSTFAESIVAAESTAVESFVASAVVLPPQDAKDTAAKAANTNTNFFILFNFLRVIQLIVLLKRCKITDFLYTTKTSTRKNIFFL
jgi:hypothetical protein